MAEAQMSSIVPSGGKMPYLSSTAFGISHGANRETKARELTTKECQEMFGIQKSVEMNFIPQMLTAIALDQAEEFCKYCGEHKLTEYKRHSRHLRKCIDEYKQDLKKAYGKAWPAYCNYLNRLRNHVATDLFKAYCTYTNEAARQYVGRAHKDIPARVAFARMLLTFCEMFDREVDRMLTNRLQTLCCRNHDKYIVLISALCVDIAESYGHKMKITPNMEMCVTVLANRCKAVARMIIEEES